MTKLIRTALAVLAACGLTLAVTACNSTSVDTPTSNSVPEPVASTSAPTPAPAPSPTPGAGGGGEANNGYEIEFGDNASFSVKNTTDIGQAYRAYTTSFDNQELETAFRVSGTVPPNESWGDSFNAQCVQLDITQHGVAGLPLKGGAAFYDKNGKQFNPSRNPEKVTECRTTPCVEKWVPVEFEDAGLTASSVSDGWGQCSATPTVNTETKVSCSQSRRVRNTCTGEIKTETQPCECACELQNPPRASISGPSFPPYTPATPAVTKTFYWYDGRDGLENDCEAEGGTFYESVNIPNDNSGDNKSNVCKTTVNHGNSWEYDNNDYASRESTVVETVTPAVPASGGNPISGSATFYNAGSWEVRLLSASSVSEYNANTPDYEKDSKEATVSCGSSSTKSVSYNWVGHGSEVWWIEVRLNGSFHSKSAYVTNPTN